MSILFSATSLLRAEPAVSQKRPEFAGPETCAGCHAAEYEEWKHSRHAGAFGEPFASYWNAHGKSAECLGCHTTGFDSPSGQFAFEGVSCESCHGPYHEGHPEAGVTMHLATDSSACATCHRQTFLEWQLSKHGQKGIRCFDCHRVHQQGLRHPSVEAQCGACHAERLQDFAHATHHASGLTCATCHLPEPKTTGVGGTGAASHTFLVGAETCAACHEETVHKSQKMQQLESAVTRLSTQPSAEELARLQEEVRQLEFVADVQRAGRARMILLALLIGVAFGSLMVLISLGRSRKDGGPS
ncbi:MAG: hypothetical protein HY352_05060 [Candidatus Omnitrophica bacterium]|nr:hypothetical protein [Candidatus Omnitrophota bacterium]